MNISFPYEIGQVVSVNKVRGKVSGCFIGKWGQQRICIDSWNEEKRMYEELWFDVAQVEDGDC